MKRSPFSPFSFPHPEVAPRTGGADGFRRDNRGI